MKTITNHRLPSFSSIPISATILLTLLPAPARCALFANGSFEDGLNAWTVVQNSGGDGVVFHGATEGTVCFAFNTEFQFGNGILAQTFDTTVGQMYSVSFDFGSFGLTDGYPQTFQTRVRDGASPSGGTDLIAVDSADFTAGSNPGSSVLQTVSLISATDMHGTGNTANYGPVPGNVQFSTVSFTFTALGSASTLVFSDQTGNAGDFTDTNIDNVLVQAIPEPNSLVLLCAGVVGLGVFGRQRHHRSARGCPSVTSLGSLDDLAHLP